MRLSRAIRHRMRALMDAKGHVDAVAGSHVSGWALHRSGPVRVEARIGDRVVASVAPDIERDDVALAFPRHAQARSSGFVLELPAGSIPADEIAEVVLEVRPAAALSKATRITRLLMAGPAMIETVGKAPETGIVGPFPRQVIDAVAALWPEACRDLASGEGQRSFLDKLSVILGVPELRSLPAIADYARYVLAIWQHCDFVEKYFPPVNAQGTGNWRDFSCKPNSVFEIMSIAHQLYVLKSYGVQGDFAEFGCFKGFSSAMLSYACQQLKLKMHIFDSFEGLPAADGSGYAAGDFSGSLDEVIDHVTRLGAASVVEFHKGFFSDTFRSYRPPHLMCLWMDVDLEISSRDLMVVADRLDRRSTLFSHECAPDMFQGGEIATAPSPANPIPPMLERFEQLGRPLTGRFLRGNTGAFWPREGGIPALDNLVLMALVRAMA